jgi:hypothetical protein
MVVILGVGWIVMLSEMMRSSFQENKIKLGICQKTASFFLLFFGGFLCITLVEN